MTYLYMGKDERGGLLLQVNLRIHQQRNHCDFLDVSFPAILAIRFAVSWNSSWQCAHDLSNVHTWAMFFLRHLANMSFMVPFWESTESGSVPIWGARVRSHSIRKRLFIVLMTAAHISPNVFSLRKFHSNIQGLFLTVYNNIIHTYYTSHSYTHLLLLFYTSCSHLHFFWYSWQAGCSRLLVSDTGTTHHLGSCLLIRFCLHVGRPIWLWHPRLSSSIQIPAHYVSWTHLWVHVASQFHRNKWKCFSELYLTCA